MRMLSYADRLRIILILSAIIVAFISMYVVFSKAYGLAKLYASLDKDYVSDEIYYVDSARRILERVFHYNTTYWSYSGKTEDDYYNLEHPPLGKYIIALSMVLCGDKPVCWRLPGIIEASLIPVIVFMAYFGRDSLRILAAVAAASAAASDYILHTAGAVAMLDIHVAFFTSLTLLAAVRGRLLLAGFLAGAAASVKMSGIAALVALIIYIYYAGWIEDKFKRIIAVIIAAASVYVVVYVPLVGYFGLVDLVKENINAIKWHVTSRPPNGPPTSTPTGWIFNVNPFYYSVSGAIVAAKLNTLVHFPALVIALILTMYHMDRGSERRVFSSVLYMSILLTYYMVFVAGNRTLYSFYGVHLTPAAAGVLAEATLILGGYGHALKPQGHNNSGGAGSGGVEEPVLGAGAEEPWPGEAEGGTRLWEGDSGRIRAHGDG